MSVTRRMGIEGMPARNRPLARPRSRWEDNIKIDLRELEWGGSDCIDLAPQRGQWRVLVEAVITLRFPLKDYTS
jgi:hypothetical protein